MHMTQNDDPKLTQLLAHWTVPQPSNDAVSRILNGALAIPQTEARPASTWNRIGGRRVNRLVIAAGAIAAALVVVALPPSFHSRLPTNDPVLQQSALVAFDMAKPTGSTEEDINE